MTGAPPPLIHAHPGPAPTHPERPEGIASGPGWAPWTAPVALVAALTATLLGGVLIGVVAAIGGASLDHPPPAVDIAGTILQDLALVSTAVLFARLGGARPRAAQFGLRATRVLPAVGWAALALVAALVFTAIWSAALAVHEREHLLHDLGADRGTASMLAVAGLVTVVAPIGEEFFFRGYFFTALRNWHGTGVAAVLTGLTFGLVHAGSAPVVYLVPLAFLGFVLCLLYRRTGSLYPCIGLHVVNNSLAFGVSEHWGWQIPVLMAAALAIVTTALIPIGRASARVSPTPA